MFIINITRVTLLQYIIVVNDTFVHTVVIYDADTVRSLTSLRCIMYAKKAFHDIFNMVIAALISATIIYAIATVFKDEVLHVESVEQAQSVEDKQDKILLSQVTNTAPASGNEQPGSKAAACYFMDQIHSQFCMDNPWKKTCVDQFSITVDEQVSCLRGII